MHENYSQCSLRRYLSPRTTHVAVKFTGTYVSRITLGFLSSGKSRMGEEGIVN